MQSIVKDFRMTRRIKGGDTMKKISLVLALAMALMLTLGIGAAMAAPGDYPPEQTSDNYTSALTGTEGKTVTSEWGLSNGQVNAHKTGDGIDVNDGSTLGKVIKNIPNQRTHGEYANDTNSCASCHQTHTASGRALLVKNGIYNTCAACHDGTLGFYNVFEASNAGTFGGNPDKAVGNASVHLATGIMKVSAAPGGNRNSADAGTWGKDFTCASCHSPHGSYSDRLLHYNPNGIGNTLPADGGKKIIATTANVVSNGTDAAGHTKYSANDGAATPKIIAGPYLYGYNYGTPKVYWSQIRVLYDADGDGTAEWNYKVKGNPTQSYNDVLEVNYRGGFFTDPDNALAGVNIATEVQWDVASATVVKFDTTTVANAAAEAMGLPVVAVTGYKSGVSGFCSACHTDYNSGSAQNPSGTFSKAFRHKIVQGLKDGMVGEEKLVNGVMTANQNMVCLTCHFAHGTDKSLMLDARDQAVETPDVNASSALKRYTNMSVCWKCHTDSKAEQLKNNGAYWDKVDAGTAPIH